LFPELGQGGAVDALRAQYVDVVELGQLFRRESLGRTKDHMPCIVDKHIQPAVLRNDGLDCILSRLLR